MHKSHGSTGLWGPCHCAESGNHSERDPLGYQNGRCFNQNLFWSLSASHLGLSTILPDRFQVISHNAAN